MTPRRVVAVAVSAMLLVVLYWQIDTGRLLSALVGVDPFWLGCGLVMIVPLTVLPAWRLRGLMPAHGSAFGLGQATRLVLMAGVLNLALPSKMGDIAKAYALTERGHLPGPLALSLVVLEKACDLLALTAFGVVGLLLLPGKGVGLWAATGALAAALAVGICLVASPAPASRTLRLVRRVLPERVGGPGSTIDRLGAAWSETLAYAWTDRTRAARLVGISLAVWLLHLVQIWLFTLALGVALPFTVNLALVPLALIAGLLPFTAAGIGTRDAALVLLYQPYMAAGTAAALGILCTARYLLPALVGLPFLGQYAASIRDIRLRGGGVDVPASDAIGLLDRDPFGRTSRPRRAD